MIKSDVFEKAALMIMTIIVEIIFSTLFASMISCREGVHLYVERESEFFWVALES